MDRCDHIEALTVEEAALCLGIGRKQAYEAIARGDIPSLRLGRRILVPTRSFHRWLESAAGSQLDLTLKQRDT